MVVVGGDRVLMVDPVLGDLDLCFHVVLALPIPHISLDSLSISGLGADADQISLSSCALVSRCYYYCC